VRRALLDVRRDPERFRVEKSCICQDLEYVAGLIEEQSKPQITVSRQRRDAMVTVISGKRVTVQHKRDPFFTSTR
jgi:hypothetical protein